MRFRYSSSKLSDAIGWLARYRRLWKPLTQKNCLWTHCFHCFLYVVNSEYVYHEKRGSFSDNFVACRVEHERDIENIGKVQRICICICNLEAVAVATDVKYAHMLSALPAITRRWKLLIQNILVDVPTARIITGWKQRHLFLQICCTDAEFQGYSCIAAGVEKVGTRVTK